MRGFSEGIFRIFNEEIPDRFCEIITGGVEWKIRWGFLKESFGKTLEENLVKLQKESLGDAIDAIHANISRIILRKISEGNRSGISKAIRWEVFEEMPGVFTEFIFRRFSGKSSQELLKEPFEDFQRNLSTNSIWIAVPISKHSQKKTLVWILERFFKKSVKELTWASLNTNLLKIVIRNIWKIFWTKLNRMF